MNSNSDVKRLDRIAAIRETIVSAAEARLREAQLRVREIQLQEDGIVRQINHIRAEISQRNGSTGLAVQQDEKFIVRLNKQRATVLQALENAKKIATQRQAEWTEARREQKIIDRVQERRLQEWQRQQEVARQKTADDTFLGKVVREKFHE